MPISQLRMTALANHFITYEIFCEQINNKFCLVCLLPIKTVLIKQVFRLRMAYIRSNVTQ